LAGAGLFAPEVDKSPTIMNKKGDGALSIKEEKASHCEVFAIRIL